MSGNMVIELAEWPFNAVRARLMLPPAVWSGNCSSGESLYLQGLKIKAVKKINSVNNQTCRDEIMSRLCPSPSVGYPGFQTATYTSRTYAGITPGYTYQFPGNRSLLTSWFNYR